MDSCLQLHEAKRLDSGSASMAKYWYAHYCDLNVVFVQMAMGFCQPLALEGLKGRGLQVKSSIKIIWKVPLGLFIMP